MFFLDPIYMLFMLPAILLMMLTQWYVNSAYKKWSRVPSRSRLTGAEVASKLIRSGVLYDVIIEQIVGRLSDNYDPRRKILR